MDQAFVRLKIEAHRQQDCTDQAVETFEVLFNPNTYSQKYEVVYHPRQGAGDTGSPQVYGKIKPQEYSFELLFDGTGTAIDKVNVPDAIERFLKVAGKHDGEIHRPRYLLLTWGKLLSKCVLKSADITYSLFEPGGNALRAKVRAVFSENIADTLRVAEERRTCRSSPIATTGMPRVTCRLPSTTAWPTSAGSSRASSWCFRRSWTARRERRPHRPHSRARGSPELQDPGGRRRGERRVPDPVDRGHTCAQPGCLGGDLRAGRRPFGGELQGQQRRRLRPRRADRGAGGLPRNRGQHLQGHRGAARGAKPATPAFAAAGRMP
jgi:hypothetical protein